MLLIVPAILIALPASQSASGSRIPIRAQSTSVQEQTSSWPSMLGRWGFLQVTTAESEVPVVGRLSSETKALAILDVRQNDHTIRTSETVCSLTTSSPVPVIRTTYPDAFIAALSGNIQTAVLKKEGKHTLFVRPKTWTVQGAQLSDIVKDTLPHNVEDPRLLDPDSDGSPGLTVHISGLVTGDIHVITRGWTKLSGRFVSDAQIEGTVEWHTEQKIISTTNRLLKAPPTIQPHSDPQRSWFRLVRLLPDVTCRNLAAVLEPN